jgi:hypothetical protein
MQTLRPLLGERTPLGYGIFEDVEVAKVTRVSSCDISAGGEDQEEEGQDVRAGDGGDVNEGRERGAS